MKHLIIMIHFCLALSFSVNAQVMTKESRIQGLIVQAKKYFDSKKYNKALRYYHKALAQKPDLPHLQIALTETYLAQKRYRKAIKTSDYIIQQMPNQKLFAYLLKAKSLEKRGKINEAIQTLESAHKDCGEKAVVYEQMAELFWQEKQILLAEKNAIRALTINIDNPNLHLKLAYILNKRNLLIKKILCLYYYLLLKPDSSISGEVLDLLMYSFKDLQTNIAYQFWADKDFIKNPTAYSDQELLEGYTKLLFEKLKTVEFTTENSYYHRAYIKLYNKINTDGFLICFCKRIGQSNNRKYSLWLNENLNQNNHFLQWLGQNFNFVLD